jgi:hypothetical protein
MNLLKNAIAGIAMASFALAPLSIMAQGHGRGNDDHGKGHEQHHNSPPKQNGRHDNRDWNKTRRPVVQHRNNGSWNGSVQSQIDRRQQTKNEWRNLAIASGGLGILGLLTKEPTLTFAGAAGALYSANRYEQDRKSQSSLSRSRAYYFSQPYFMRDGHRFDRRTVTKNGQRYYQFVRHG